MDFEQAYMDEVRAYMALREQWMKTLERAERYRVALESISGQCPAPCVCREEGCDKVCRIAREALK
jgi:hypothetical protein